MVRLIPIPTEQPNEAVSVLIRKVLSSLMALEPEPPGAVLSQSLGIRGSRGHPITVTLAYLGQCRAIANVPPISQPAAILLQLAVVVLQLAVVLFRLAV